MSFAVFLQPLGALELEIENWKNKVEKVYPNQPFTCHPPHLTLINLEVINEIASIETIIKQIENIKPFKIQINSTAVFWNDELTGGHTLHFEVNKNSELYRLQKKVAYALYPGKKIINPPDYILKNNDLLNSFNKFGFPFIGHHWIPHFSISSIKKGKNDSLIREFLATEIDFSLIIDKVGLWRVQDDFHEKLNNILLT